MKKNLIYIFTITATLASSTLAPGVIADQRNPITLEEIVVMAQKRQQTVQEVPRSIMALNEELLSKTNTTHFKKGPKQRYLERRFPAERLVYLASVLMPMVLTDTPRASWLIMIRLKCEARSMYRWPKQWLFV